MGLVGRLLDEPWSRYRAKLLGGEQHWRDHLGWGPAEYLHAALIDAVQINTAVAAAHGSGKKPSAPPVFPRPKPVETAPEELDAAQIAAYEDELNSV